MAILNAAGTGADYKAEKKRKEKRPEIAAVKIYDPENRAASISRAYYNKTGKLPGPAKLYSFVAATEGFQKEEQFRDLFPDWVSRLEPDPEDIAPETLIVSRSERAFENRLRQKYSPPGAAHRGGDVGYDKTAYRLATLTEGAKAPAMLYDDKNRPVLDNVRALQHDPEMKRLVNGVHDVVSPGKLEDLREKFAGKTRDELTSQQRDQLDEMAIFLASKYDETDKFSTAYDNDLNNVTWDKNFDAFVSRLAFESVAAHAIIPDAVGDPNGIKKAQAMKVIEVATNGAVKDTDDIYTLLSTLALRGDTSSVYGAGEQMQRFLYEGWVKGRKTGSDRARTAAYAEEFGVYYLPADVQVEYRSDLKDWMETLGEPNEVYLKWREAEDAANRPEQTSRVMNTRFIEDTLLMMTENINKGDEVLREKWDDDKLVEFEPGGTFKFSEARLFRQGIVPAISDVENTMKIAWPALKTMELYEKNANRIWLTMAFVNEMAWRAYQKERAEGQKYDEDGNPLSSSWDPSMELAKKARGTIPYFPSPETELVSIVPSLGTTVTSDHLAWSDWSSAWTMAGVRDEQAQSYMREAFKNAGIDPDENGTWLWVSDFVWSTSKDLFVDAGVTGIFGVGKKAAVQIGRKTLSPKLEAQVIQAQARRASLIAERNRLQKLGQFDTTAWKANKEALQLADTTVELLNRPQWYDTMARGLSRTTQKPDVVKRVFNISFSGMDPVRTGQVKDLIRRIGLSTDEDATVSMMNQLRVEHGIRLDPGAAFIGSQKIYAKLMLGRNVADHPLMTQTFPSSMRISDSVADVTDWMERLGGVTNMGFGPARKFDANGNLIPDTNTVAGRRRLNEYMDEAWNAADDSARRRLWDEFMKEIQFNARTQVLDGSELAKINKWLLRNGYDALAEGATRWQGFRAISKTWKNKRTEGFTKKTRMYLAKVVENDETRVKEIVEGSTVKTAQKKPRKGMIRRIVEACDEDLKNAQNALNDARIAGADGDEITMLTHEVKAAELRQAAAREISKEKIGEPWLRDQLAKDLTLDFNIHQFAAFNSGQYGILSYLHTPGTALFGVPWGAGPSIAQATSAFRFLAVARAGFFLTVNAGDEFFRLAFTGTWGEMLSRAYWKTWWGKAKTTAQYAEVVDDTIVQLMRASDSWGYAHPGDPVAGIPQSADYGVHLNGWLRMQGNDPITSLFIAFRRNADEADDAFVERFVANVKDKVEDPLSEEGAIIRDFLERTNRLWRSDFHFADEIAAQNKILSAQEQKAWTDYAQADSLLRENSERIAELRKVVGSFGKPGKKFKASWLRSRYARPATARQATDEEVLSAFGDLLEDPRIAREMEEDYRRQVVQRRARGGEKPSAQAQAPTPATTVSWGRPTDGAWRSKDGRFWIISQKEPGEPMWYHIGADADGTPEGAIMHNNSEGTLAGAKKFVQENQDEIDALTGKKGGATPAKREAAQATDIESAYNELLDLQARRQVLMDDRKAAVKAKDKAVKAAGKGYGRELPDTFYDYVRERGIQLAHFDRYDGPRRVLRGGDDLSKNDVQKYIDDARNSGDEPLPVTAIRPRPEAQNIFMRMAENTPTKGKNILKMLPGPFWALDKSSGLLKRLVYTGKLQKEYGRLIALGVDEDEALAMAGHYAMQYTNRAMYTNSMTAFEYMTKDIILFQPAFRQFAVFWSKTWARHPMLLANLRSKYGTDFPQAVFGDWAWIVPMPFWMQGSLGDIALPGLGPGPLLAFRFANYLSGWSRQDDGTWVYTGDTKLDWIGEEIPLLSFMSKTSSPLLWLDDLFDGLGGYDLFRGLMPEDRVSTGQMLLEAAFMPLFRDPVARRKYHMNVAQAQMSRGLKPDFDGAMNEMMEKPWWYKLFPGFRYPESAVSAVTRLVSPVGKQRFVPSDIGEVRADKSGKPIWSDVFGGDNARTMADAWWEWSAAYGDEVKMQNVLNKYPKFAKVREYYKLSAGERAEFLRNPDNWYLIPYVTGKKTYNYGIPMIEGELWYQMQNGQTYYKTVDEYTEDVYQLFQTAGWDKTRVKLDRDLKTDLKTAREFAKEAAIAQSVTTQQVKDRMEWYDNWAKGWWDNKTAGNPTTPSGNVPDDWLELYAQKKGKKPLEWNPIAIQERYQESLMTVAQSVYGKKPEDVSKYGVSARYTNRAIYDEKQRKDALRVANALTDLLPAKWQPLFDPTTATSIDELNRLTKESEQYNAYLAKTLAGDEWFKLGNVAKQMRSIGADMHISDRALNNNVLALDNLYAKYTEDIAGVKEMSDEYKAIRAEYLDARDKILSRPGMEMLNGGPVARLAAMYSKGGKLDENYRRHILAVVNKSQINWTDLVMFWMDRNPLGEYDGPKSYENAVARAAWLSLAVVAQDFRTKMRRTWNDTMNAYGISPDAKASRVYLYKMRDFVTMWGRTSDLFRRQWMEAGGDALLTNSLDNYY